MTVEQLNEKHLELLSLKGGAQARLSLHLSNATLLEITCHGSCMLLSQQNCDARENAVYSFPVQAVFPYKSPI